MVLFMNTFKDAPELGPQLQTIRKQRNLTLEQLAERSGVSKSMLSQIERGQTNPTFGTLWNLTRALGIEITDLMAGHQQQHSNAVSLEHVQANMTPMIKSPNGQCRLRILSPVSTAGSTEWYEMIIEPGGILDSQPHSHGTIEHLTCLEGSLQVGVGDSESVIHAGDTLRYPADITHYIRNIDKAPSSAILVVIS